MRKAPAFKRPHSPAPLHRSRDGNGDALQADGRQSAAKRGYDGRWQRTRVGFIAKHPLCVCCLANGETSATELVDHIVPHRGDMALFWKRDNWQALCNWCHEHVKKPLEARWDEGRIGVAELRLDRELTEFFD